MIDIKELAADPQFTKHIGELLDLITLGSEKKAARIIARMIFIANKKQWEQCVDVIKSMDCVDISTVHASQAIAAIRRANL